MINITKIHVFALDWLKQNKLPLQYEYLPTEDIAELLRKLYGTVLSKKGNEYSKSGLVNLWAGLNRHLQQPPYKRTVDLMNDRAFLQANKVFTGHLRDNKEKGLDTSKPRIAIEQDDMEKLFKEYFTPAMKSFNPKVLVQKVFFDIVYYTGRRGKEGLRSLDKKSFELKTGNDVQEYIQLTFNEKTKRNQGDQNSSALDALHNDQNIISAQPGSILCPVHSFKTYVANLNENCNALFQYPNKENDGFDRKPIGKNTIGEMMKEISNDAKLSCVYTNHCIRKTTVTGLRRQGFELDEIQNVTKHKNLDSLKHYLSAPTYKDKKKYNEALLKYAEKVTYNEDAPPTKRRSNDKKKVKNTNENPSTSAATPVVIHENNIDTDNSLVPVFYDTEHCNDENIIPTIATQQSSVVNQMRQASNMFQSATFNNCNFTFQMPK